MSRFRAYLFVVIASALSGMIGAAFGTGTAQAVVSTLVTVVNPGTSPVRTSSVDDPGRIAYQAILTTSACDGVLGGAGCQITFPSVPAGHRVVVQHVTGFSATGSPTSGEVDVVINIAANFKRISAFGVSFPTNNFVFDQSVLFYLDSGDTASVSMTLNSGVFLATTFSLVGYELDCTVAACAPIATQ